MIRCCARRAILDCLATIPADTWWNLGSFLSRDKTHVILISSDRREIMIPGSSAVRPVVSICVDLSTGMKWMDVSYGI